MTILALLVAAAAVGPTDGKVAGLDDWHAMTIYGVAGDKSGPTYLQVHAGDLDGDGLPDDAVVRLTCAAGELRTAHYTVKSPRDSASGQATGKRMHKPVTITKEWGAATPQLMQVKPRYDVKAAKGARMTSDGGGWTSLKLANAEGLCPATEAAVTATKTRSNIQNN